MGIQPLGWIPGVDVVYRERVPEMHWLWHPGTLSLPFAPRQREVFRRMFAAGLFSFGSSGPLRVESQLLWTRRILFSTV